MIDSLLCQLNSKSTESMREVDTFLQLVINGNFITYFFRFLLEIQDINNSHLPINNVVIKYE